MYTSRVFGTAKSVPFIEVSLFQGVLNKGFPCIHVYTYIGRDKIKKREWERGREILWRGGEWGEGRRE